MSMGLWHWDVIGKCPLTNWGYTVQCTCWLWFHNRPIFFTYKYPFQDCTEVSQITLVSPKKVKKWLENVALCTCWLWIWKKNKMYIQHMLGNALFKTVQKYKSNHIYSTLKKLLLCRSRENISKNSAQFLPQKNQYRRNCRKINEMYPKITKFWNMFL